MRVIYRIARAELSSLFFSPIAWLVLTVFTIQSGVKFTDMLSGYLMVQSMGIKREMLTANVFGGSYGFFGAVLSNIYLYIPLLTMGLISRETSSGSIKLLLSSPIRIAEIVLGKYLAMMVYGLLLVFIVGLFAVTGSISIRHMDTGLVVSGLIGIYLLINAYAAIGLFMSSLTTYQVVAAISTIMTLGLLGYIGNTFQRYDFVRDITYFLSISGRAEEFSNGLMLSTDVCYFLVVILLFLGLAFLKLLSDTESIAVSRRILRYSLFVTGILLTGYVSSRPALTTFADMTAGKRRTLTKNSQGLIRQFKEPLTITTYVNLLADYYYFGLPESRNIDKKIFQSYQLFMPGIKMKYVYYYDRPTDTTNNWWVFNQNRGLSPDKLEKKIADARNVDPAMFEAPGTFRTKKDLRSEGYAFTREIRYGGRSTYLRMFRDPTIVPSEQEISAALKRLLMKPPCITFLTGNGERRIGGNGQKDYKDLYINKTLREALINQGFDIDTLSLQGSSIPDSIAVLVIADPKAPFSEADLQKIRSYIDKGGNLLLCGEPARPPNMQPLMQMLGIRMVPGTIATHTNDYEPDLLLAHLPADAARMSPSFEGLRKAGTTILFSGVSGLQYSDTCGYYIRPFFTTDAATSWNTTARIDPEVHDLNFTAAAGDQRGPYPVMLTLTRKSGVRQQRIVVAGDADFMSSGSIFRSGIPNVANAPFVTGLFGWFSDGQFPVDVTRPKGEDNTIKVTKEGLAMTKWVFFGILPGLIFGIGTVMLVRRKRR